nr:T9SS type A sorting domain-containing protein [Flavobacterium sp.]
TNEFVANKFTVSPNPTKDLLSISSANNLISTIAIKDLNGRVVMQKGFNKVSQAQVNVAELATGVYMMNVTSDAGSFTKKIIKQ